MTTTTYSSAGLTSAALVVLIDHQADADGLCRTCRTVAPCPRREAAVRTASRLRYLFPIPSMPTMPTARRDVRNATSTPAGGGRCATERGRR